MKNPTTLVERDYDRGVAPVFLRRCLRWMLENVGEDETAKRLTYDAGSIEDIANGASANTEHFVILEQHLKTAMCWRCFAEELQSELQTAIGAPLQNPR